jgi:hypothetical protein
MLGPWGAVPGLALGIGIPAVVVLYLSQPHIKQAGGALVGSFSSVKTLGLILAVSVVAFLVFRWLLLELGKAIGQGIR